MRMLEPVIQKLRSEFISYYYYSEVKSLITVLIVTKERVWFH